MLLWLGSCVCVWVWIWVWIWVAVAESDEIIRMGRWMWER